MNRIRRVLLSRVGYHDAWYDGTLLHFHGADGEPDHSIVSLPNGEGKTTLLSLIFSVFVPRQQRFVQHLQKADHHFRDYFGPRPGFVVVEMQRPGGRGLFPDDPQDRFIAGQMVCLQERNQEPVRVFFSFSPGPGLSFEGLPIRGLGGSDEIRDLETARRWLHETREAHPQFRTFTAQQDWEKHLEEEGADPWLVERQVDFCGAEGGIDGFLDFRSEADFLRRFYAMALQTDAAESARETLGEALRKQRARPDAQDRIQVLGELAAAFAPFAVAAAERGRARERLAQAEGCIGALHAALLIRRERLEADQARHEQDRETCKTRLDDLAARHREAEGRREAIEALRQAALVAEAQGECDGARLREVEADRERRRVAAAQALVPLRETEARIAVFRAALLAAEKDVEPVLTRAQTAGSRLRARLAWEADEARRTQARLAAEGATAEGRRGALGKTLVALQADRSQAEKEQGALQERVAARQRARDALVQAGSMVADEAPSAALERHRGDLALAKGRRAEIRAADAALEQERTALMDKRTGHLAAAATVEATLAGLRASIAEGESRRERLAGSVLLRQLTGAEEVDPDTDGIPERIEAHVLRLETKRLQDYRAIQDLDLDRGSIAANGLAAPEGDAQVALEWLIERGIGANALGHYPAYLAETQPGAEAARRCLESDPARFGGLYVYREQELERIRALSRDGLKLRRPVQVSLPRTEPAAPPADALVLSQPFDAAYDKSAAAEYARDLDARHAEIQGRIDGLEGALGKARATAGDLDAYLQTFGAGRLAGMSQDALGHEQEIARLKTAVDECSQRLEEIRGRRAELEDEADRIGEARERAARRAQALGQFIDAHESGLAETLERLRELEEKIESLRADIEETEAKREALADEISRLRGHAEEAGRSAKTFDDRYAAIDQYDDRIVLAEDSWRTPPLPQLQTDCRTAWQALDAVTREKGLDEMKARIEEAERTRGEQEGAYRKALAGVGPAEVEPLLAQNLDALAATAVAELEAARSDGSVWGERLRTRKVEADKLAKTRKHPRATVTNLEAADIAELEEASSQVGRLLQALATDQEQEQTKLGAAEDAIRTGKGRLRQLDTWIDTLAGDVPPEGVPPSLELPAADEGIGQLHKESLDALRSASKAAGEADASARDRHEKIRRTLEQETLLRLEPQIAVELRGNRFEDACAAAQTHVQLVADRIETCRFELDKLDENLDLVRLRLQQLLDEAVWLLNRAVTGSKIPAEVPHFGDQPILKMGARFGKLAPESRGERLRHYIDRLARDDRLPASGADLAAELVGEAAHALSPDGGLGLAFLKPTDLGPRHLPIDKRVGSGGESMTAALFLYLVMAQLRSRSKAVGGKANSGFLILDNPFGKANKVTLIRPQVELARRFGIQLIYATGIQDYNALAEFGHLVRLRRVGTHSGTGRTHLAAVESAEYDIHAQPA